MNLQEKLKYEFQNQMDKFHDDKIGLAVSGGGDSIAMLVLASEWATLNKKKIYVVTVNHNLRKEAKEEVNFTREFTKKLGFSHSTLDWKRPTQVGNLQSQASLARKKLISDWAKENKIKTVLLAHTIDDQVETILMRFSRGSGVDGLVGMKKLIDIHGIYWLRPLLNITRSDLRKFLKFNKLDWVEDPTNEDRKYLRVKSRNIISQLRKMGINTDLVVNTSVRMKNAKKVLDDVAVEAFNNFITLKKWGDIEVNKDIFSYCREDTILRTLAGIIKGISGSVYRPRYRELINFAEGLNNKNFKARTLSGVLARAISKNKIVLRREPSHPICISNFKSKNFIWDGRWFVSLAKPLSKSEYIGPLGNNGYQQIKNQVEDKKTNECFLSTPTLFLEDKVISSPAFEYGNGISCKLQHNKKQFINCFITH